METTDENSRTQIIEITDEKIIDHPLQGTVTTQYFQSSD